MEKEGMNIALKNLKKYEAQFKADNKESSTQTSSQKLENPADE